MPSWIEIAGRQPGSVLLHRAATAAEAARSLLFCDPEHVLQALRPEEVAGVLEQIEPMLAEGYFLAGFVAYEAGYALEPSIADLATRLPDDEPLVWLGCYRAPLMCDVVLPGGSGATAGTGLDFSWSKEEYAAKVEEVRGLIARGDTYQANLTMDAAWATDEPAEAMFRRLLRAQPVPYAALLHPVPGWQMVSLSPELFFQRRGDRVVTRPMKGTASPGRTEAEAQANVAWLQADEKNRAENVMIVDLLRNDLGRVCEIGSVRVTKLCAVERYPTVLQMTSTVEGRLRPGTTYAEMFRALFPSGSIVGAPKIHTARLLHRLEGRPRGVYTGAIGFIAPDGRAEFNVAIRTVSLRGGRARLGVGSGITFDSDPHDEYAECVTKTRFLTQPSFSIFETVLLRRGELPLLDLHLERMRLSAEHFGFVYERERVMGLLAEAQEALAGSERVRVRLLLHSGGQMEWTSTPMTAADSAPLEVLLSPERTDAADKFLRHKTTLRARYDLALETAQAEGFGDALFCNREDEVTEGTIHSVLVRLDGEWVTPLVRCGALPGVYRSHLLKCGLAVERVISLQELAQADGVLLCNALRGVRRVTRIAQQNSETVWVDRGRAAVAEERLRKICPVSPTPEL